MKRKLLLISKFIAPTQAVASIRWTKLAKYLYGLGEYEIVVLTDEKRYDGVGGNAYRRDEMLEKDMHVFAQYHVVPDKAALQKYYALKCRYSDYTKPAAKPPEVSDKKQVIYEVMHDIKDWLQYRQTISYLKAHPELLDCDTVVTSYGPVWTHLVGEWVKKRRPQVYWVADYRDLFYQETTPPLVKLWRQNFAKRHTARASLITAVSEELLPMLRLPDKQRTMVLQNGFDPDEGIAPLRSDRFSLLYTGTIYSQGTHKSDLTPIFASLSDLIQCGVMDANDILLEYAGAQGRLFLEQAQSCGLGDRVKDYGVLGRQQTALLRQNAAALLLCTWNTAAEKGILTGKLYEYMLSQKPIFATCTGDEPNSAVKAVLHNGRLGYCCEVCRPDDRQELQRELESAYLQWKKTGVLHYQPDKTYVEQFSYPVLAEKLHQYICKR